MPVFFFDLQDGDQTDADELGLEFDGIVAARVAGIGGLLDAGKDLFTELPAQLSMSIRDSDGKVHAVLRVRVWDIVQTQ